LFGATCALAQDWPQWRGPGRDNHVAGFKAPDVWPKDLTKKWKVTVGIGESSPTLVGNRLYVLGRQQGDKGVQFLDADTGKPLWKDKYPTEASTGGSKAYPGPRSTVAVGEGKVVSLGLRGAVSCYDAESGKLLWRKNSDNKQNESYPKFFTAS